MRDDIRNPAADTAQHPIKNPMPTVDYSNPQVLADLLASDKTIAGSVGVGTNQLTPDIISAYNSQVADRSGGFAEQVFMDKILPALVIGGATAGAFAPGGVLGAAGGASAGAGTGTAAGTIPTSAAGDITLTDATAGLGDMAAPSLGGTGAIAPAAEASSGMMPELTVTAPSTAGTGIGVGDVAAPALAAAPAVAGMLPEQTVTAQSTANQSSSDLLSGNGPLLASLGAVPGAMSDIGPTLNSGQPQFLSANDTQPSLQPMSSDLASQLGIDPSSISTDMSFDASLAADNPGYGPMNIADASWFENPKNLATLGSLGISGLSALSKPKLPGASQTAANNATALTKSAMPIIQSGGTAGPQWAGQKASIDATIDQQIQQQSAAIQQAAVNSGEGNQNSGIVQQQIAEMTRQANVQRQQLYSQAQQQNVQNAMAELSGGDQILASIGNMQLEESLIAQEQAAKTAELALRLYSMTGQPG